MRRAAWTHITWLIPVFVFLRMAGPDAQTSTVLSPMTIALLPGIPFVSPKIPLDRRTASTTFKLRRPTTANPLNWTAAQQVKVELVQVVDGVESVSGGIFSGGIRLNKLGQEMLESSQMIEFTRQLRIDATHQPFVDLDGKTKVRATWIGETARTEWAVFYRLTLLSGTAATLTIAATVDLADPPAYEVHNSVAFDAATDGTEIAGDGVLTLSHTPAGTANLAAFVGSGNSAATPQNGSTAYGASAMTEMWDKTFSVLGYAGDRLQGIPTSTQSVVHTLAAAVDEHFVGVITMTGVNQTTPVGVPSTSAVAVSNPSVTVANVASSDLVVDSTYYYASAGSATILVGAAQTERNREIVVAGQIIAVQSTQAGSDGGFMSWSTGGVTTDWSQGAVAFKPVVTVALTGTVTSAITETDVVAGGKTVILTTTDDTYVPAAGVTTLSYVGGCEASGAAASFTLTLPTVLQNDLVIIAAGWVGAADGNPGVSDGAYTEIADRYANDTRDANFSINWKLMGAVPDTTASIFGSGLSTNSAVAVCQVWRGANQSVPVESSSSTVGTDTSAPDSPVITPSTTGAVIITAGLGTSVAVDNAVNAPNFYGNQVDISADAGNAATIGIASRTDWVSGTENPAVWANWTNSTSDSYGAATLSIAPAATTPFATARTAIATGLTSAQAEGTGWNAVVKTNIPAGNVVRTSDTQVTITLQAQSDYNISAQETITATVPATALVAAGAVIATPTFTVDTDGGAPPPAVPAIVPKRLLLLGGG